MSVARKNIRDSFFGKCEFGRVAYWLIHFAIWYFYSENKFRASDSDIFYLFFVDFPIELVATRLNVCPNAVPLVCWKWRDIDS